jgi:hypothetical protein
MASSRPTPAFSMVSPRAANRPVPMIVAAVRSIAVVRPRMRRNEEFGSDAFCSVTIKQLLRYARPSMTPAFWELSLARPA